MNKPVFLLSFSAALLLGASARGAQPELKPCGPEGREREVLCGTIEVPEDRSRTSGRLIALNLAVVKALEPTAGATPLFHLEGGPGVPATLARRFYLDEGREYRRTRDVVLLDQRGTGGSNPLRCAALENRDPLAEMYPVELVRRCRAELERSADLTQYGSLAAAADLDQVRAALDYDRMDIWALSYGTFLAQVYMRAHPGRVRSAVFFGTVNMDPKLPLYHAVTAQRALDLVFFDCQSDPACSAAYPHLRREWRQLVRRLKAGAVSVRRIDAATGKQVVTALHLGPFAEALRSQMGSALGARRVPHFIHRAAQGDFGPFLESLEGGGLIPDGIYLSVACAEGTTRIRDGEVERYTAGTFVGGLSRTAADPGLPRMARHAVSGRLLRTGVGSGAGVDHQRRHR